MKSRSVKRSPGTFSCFLVFSGSASANVSCYCIGRLSRRDWTNLSILLNCIFTLFMHVSCVSVFRQVMITHRWTSKLRSFWNPKLITDRKPPIKDSKKLVCPSFSRETQRLTYHSRGVYTLFSGPPTRHIAGKLSTRAVQIAPQLRPLLTVCGRIYEDFCRPRCSHAVCTPLPHTMRDGLVSDKFVFSMNKEISTVVWDIFVPTLTPNVCLSGM